MIELPRRLLPSLRELGSQVLERRGAEAPPATLARDLLDGFYDVCTHAGQDGVLVRLSEAFAPLEIADGSSLSEEPRLKDGLAALLADRARFDPGGPRVAMPSQLADCLIATLTLELHDPPVVVPVVVPVGMSVVVVVIVIVRRMGHGSPRLVREGGVEPP